MNKQFSIEKLVNLSDKLGIVSVLNEFTPNVNVRIPMSQNLWDSSIDELTLSVRSSNGIRRAGARTIGDVADIIMSETSLKGVRNLGKKSISEIKTAILVLSYDRLNNKEKLDFWHYVVNEN